MWSVEKIETINYLNYYNSVVDSDFTCIDSASGDQELQNLLQQFLCQLDYPLCDPLMQPYWCVRQGLKPLLGFGNVVTYLNN